MLLQAYYEPQFSSLSHGYRPQKGCHTALQEIGKWHGTKWFIEADLEKCFDSINHDVLVGIIGTQIHDHKLLKLLRIFLRAGYLEQWQYHSTYSGTPQGSGLSPLLSNVLLNEFDRFMENELLPRYTQGKTKRENPAYKRITTRIGTAKKNKDVTHYNLLCQQRRCMPSRETHDPDFRRLRYVRYADDMLLGFVGSSTEARTIKQEIAHFLQSLKLTLSLEKTLITHATSQRARFLGYNIRIAQDNNNSLATDSQVNLPNVPSMVAPFFMCLVTSSDHGVNAMWRMGKSNTVQHFCTILTSRSSRPTAWSFKG